MSDNVSRSLRIDINFIGSPFSPEDRVLHRTLFGEWVLGFRELLPVWTVCGHADEPGRLLIRRSPGDCEFYHEFELIGLDNARRVFVERAQIIPTMEFPA